MPGRFDLSRPPRADVLLFDQCNEGFVRQSVLADLDYFVLHRRGECWHLAPSVLVRCLANLLRLSVRFPAKTLKKPAAMAFHAYCLAVIQCVRPKVVLTFIDNYPGFHFLSGLYPEADFASIQNGVRGSRTMRGMADPLDIRHYFCFGEHDAQFLARHGHTVRHPHPVGSLKAGFYKTEHSETGTDFDLCLISQYRTHVVQGGDYPEMRECYHRINSLLAGFLKAHPDLRLCVACAGEGADEAGYFRSYFGQDTAIVPNDKAAYTTYRCMDRSRVMVAWDSTAAFEAFGWGKKVLFCNFGGSMNTAYDLPSEVFLDQVDPALFEARLLALLDMDQAGYEARFRDAQARYMNWNPARPAHAAVREFIDQRLGERPGPGRTPAPRP